MKNYLQRVYDSRFFWGQLVNIELKNKFRRSKLGILWTFVNPLCLTGIMALVLGTVFKQDLVTYTPYILSGMLFWDLVNASFIGGSTTIIGNESYIRQFNHPISIYMLKSSLVFLITFLIAMIALIAWVLVVAPQNLIIALISLPVTLVLFFILAFSGTIISAYANTKYRDYPQMMALIMQTLWYISPVFFQESMFEHNEFLSAWFQLNPITHILQLIRTPFLFGQYPTAANYIVTIFTVTVFAFWAYRIDKKNSRHIIFYV